MLDLVEHVNFLNWNVRGLNGSERRDVVHAAVAASACHIVCLQETKLQDVDAYTAAYLGGYRLRSFA